MSALQPNVDLLTLLSPPPFSLAYSLPLLFVSLLLTFSGAFFTLDRSRSFSPRHDSTSSLYGTKGQKQWHWRLGGGLGGLASGYTFGVHFTTFLTLLIPNKSPATPPLTSKSFLPVWLLPALVTTALAGRWKYCALAFSGLSGGAALSLSLSVILHPSLLSRVVLTAIFVPILTILTLLPLARTQHAALRLAASATGAFGVVLAIALLARIPAWADVWERLWRPASLEWGTPKERGLSAAWCFLLCAGTACDWLLRRQFGENPDEIWDQYLANYTAELPSAPDRAGTFQPMSYSVWDRLFGRAAPSHPAPLPDIIRWPHKDHMQQMALVQDGKTLATTAPAPPLGVSKPELGGDVKHGRGGGLRAMLKIPPHKREGAKFKPLDLDDDSSSDSDADDNVKAPAPHDKYHNSRPLAKVRASQNSTTTSSGSATLNGGDDHAASTRGRSTMRRMGGPAEAGPFKKAAAAGEGVPEYSDHEDMTAHADQLKRRASRGTPGWSPEFMQRHRGSARQRGAPAMGTGVVSAPIQAATSPGAVSVPATPSLIKAIDRLAAAQRQAYTKREGKSGAEPEVESAVPAVVLPLSPPSLTSREAEKLEPELELAGKERGRTRAAKWDGFWSEVREKARS